MSAAPRFPAYLAPVSRRVIRRNGEGRRRNLAGWIVVALVVASCGDGAGDSSATSTTIVPTTAQVTTPATTEVTPTSTHSPATSSGTPLPGAAPQEGNSLPVSHLAIRASGDLPMDIRMGVGLYPADDPSSMDYLLAEFVAFGVHRIDLSFTDIEPPISWDRSETEIAPGYDRFIDNLNDQGIAVNYMLHFWDKEARARGEELATPRFKSEEQIQDFLDYVRLVVSKFRGRIQYYTIWSEPDYCGDGGIKCIEPADYIELARRVIPVIREEDPAAKVALAPLVLFHARDFMATLLTSDVIAMFDVIQWHGTYNVLPDDDFHGSYYNDYPEIAEDIRRTAEANSARAEYWATEISLCSVEYDPGCFNPDWPLIETDVQAAKYYARSVVLHLGMDIGVSYKTYKDTAGPATYSTLGRLHTLLSGAVPAAFGIALESPATDIVTIGFVTADGDEMLALWADGVAVEDDPGAASTLTLSGLAGRTAVATDVLTGIQQELIVEHEGGDLVIPDLLIKDYPIIVRLFE